jgi:predicted phosphodiesterase
MEENAVIIQYISDIHLEHLSSIPFEKISRLENATVFVLAGDIGRPNSKLYKELIEWASATFEHVLVVLGNHECYGSSVDEAFDELKNAAEGFGNVHVLHRTVWMHPNQKLVFAGATLWSEMNEQAYKLLNDRQYISSYKTSQRMMHTDFLRLHKEDLKFFENVLKDYNLYHIVCISHHAPLVKMNGKYEGNEVSTGFCTDLSRLFKPPLAAWICGHTHQSICIKENNISCVSNCLGYKFEQGFTGYRKNATLKICYDT